MNSYQQVPSTEQPRKQQATARPSLGSREQAHAASAPSLPAIAMHELGAIPIWPVAPRQSEPVEESPAAPVIQRVRNPIGAFSTAIPKSTSPDGIVTTAKQRLDQRRLEIEQEIQEIGLNGTEEVLPDVQALVVRMNELNLELEADIARLGVDAASTVLVKGDENHAMLMKKVKALVEITDAIAEELNVGVEGANTREEQRQGFRARDDRAAMKIGTEFTFTSDEIGLIPSDRKRVGNPITRKLVEHWNEVMTSKASRGYMGFKIVPEQFKGEQAFRYIYPELGGWWYRVSVDPGCVETQTQPTMAEEFAGLIGDAIRDDIFGTAKAIKLKPSAKAVAATQGYQQTLGERVDAHEGTHGPLADYASPEGAPEHPVVGMEAGPSLAPHELYGGGHLSLDLGSTFGNDPVLFRNFIVDYTNNPWAMAALDPDNLTGPTIAELPPENQRRFREIIEAFDVNLARGEAARDFTIQDLAALVEEGVYTVSLHPSVTTQEKFRHNQALNFEHIRPGVDPAEQRIEVRRVRAQSDIEQLLLQIRMFRERINQLAALGPGELVPLTFGRRSSRSEQLTDTYKTAEEDKSVARSRVDGLRDYAEQAGLHAEEWMNLLMRMDRAFAESKQ